MSTQTPSQRAKDLGCNSIAQVGRAVNQSVQTLINWHKNKSAVFDACCMYTAQLNKEDANHE